ncbi:MAG TPA: FHA domain-containing protein [Kofleriaceae bacterium]|nr:FHA domain-containing protein [Kofleriaceae bacterium]
MFLRHLDFIFAPFRAINNKILGVKNIKGNIQVDINRSKSLANRGKNFAGKMGGVNQQMQSAAGQQPQQAQLGPGGVGQPGQYQQYQQGATQMQQPGVPAQGMHGQMGAPGTPGQPGAQPGMPSPNPPVRTTGFWVWKKKFCTQCEQQLDQSWDACPYCAQIAQQAAIPEVKRQAMKTQAFVMDAAGGPGSCQLCGWIIPLQGAQRGELFTLSPKTTVGTDPKCTVVLNDKFMSSTHAEITAENGVWVLRDSGSTNGTYVNNRRVDRHELVDNDFVKFGSAMLKFKSL